MGWSAYEVFTVISGLILIGWAFVEDGGDDIEVTLAMRVGAVAAGVVFIGYAIFVANQTQGIWTFPAFIFALPVLALYRLGKRFLDGPASGASSSPDRPAQRSPQQLAPRPWQPSPGQAASFPTTPDGPATPHAPEPDPPAPDIPPQELANPHDDITVDDPIEFPDDDLTIDDPDALQQLLAEQQATCDEPPTAGWYADPGGSDELRWWDGTAWTSATRAPS